jgi:hypothetical protein
MMLSIQDAVPKNGIEANAVVVNYLKLLFHNML